ncbi:hypothetical protein AB0B63_29040 [Micromonospora sp. NPDC049081]|uniref:hypothetical protein n=1 Tax=Micromonospora sp. NPDC049081 TaxID=3155150 RepID=UPI00340DD91F
MALSRTGRRWCGVHLAALLAVALAAPLPYPGAAVAGTGLGDGDVLVARTAQDYVYRTYQRRWSVVAVQPAATADWDLTLRDAAGTTLATSWYGLGRTDFVVVDSTAGHRPFGAYTAAVSAYTAGPYWVQQRTDTTTITLPPVTHSGTTGAADPDLTFSSLVDHDVITVADLYLTAGESFWANTTTAASSLLLAESDPADPTTFAQGRATVAARQHTQVLDGCTLYTAQRTGWHALVQLGDRAPSTHVPTQGTGYALHRVDPARPLSCPQREFPGPTP